jgi:hypothetical protein
VLAAVNALGENQREYTEQIRLLVDGQRQLSDGQRQLSDAQRETDARVRSVEENLAEMRDLLVRALGRPDQGGWFSTPLGRSGRLAPQSATLDSAIRGLIAAARLPV